MRQGSRNNYEFPISNLDLADGACRRAIIGGRGLAGTDTGCRRTHRFISTAGWTLLCAGLSPCAALCLSWLFDIEIDSCRLLFANYCVPMAETMRNPGLSAQRSAAWITGTLVIAS